MTTVFTTKNGSTYELDAEAKRIRRLGGEEPQTARQVAGVEGAGQPDADGWQEYLWTYPEQPVAGRSLFVCLRETPARAQGWKTSPVTLVAEPACRLEAT